MAFTVKGSLCKTFQCCVYTKSFYAQKYFGANVDEFRDKWMKRIHMPVDFRLNTILRFIERRQWDALKSKHTHRNIKGLKALGPDLGAAHFMIYIGGAVKFVDHQNWVEPKPGKTPKIPRRKVDDMFLEAIDCSNTDMMYESFGNLADLEHLKYLKLSGCQYIDDWCMDKLSDFKDTLVHLDLSGCPNVTENGLASLHRLTNLKRLEMGNMPKVRTPELVALMLEEALPGCRIEGTDHTNSELTNNDIQETPSFITNFEEAILRDARALPKMHKS